MKIIIDLDPKLQRKLEAMGNARGRTVSDIVTDLLNRMLTRDPSASSASSEGIPSPATTDAAKKHLVPVAAAAVPPAAPAAPAATMEDLVFLIEPLVSRFRLTDGDGSQRRALLAEMQMLPQDAAVKQVTALLKQSLG